MRLGAWHGPHAIEVWHVPGGHGLGHDAVSIGQLWRLRPVSPPTTSTGTSISQLARQLHRRQHRRRQL